MAVFKPASSPVIHLWPLLWVSVTENQNCWTVFSGSLPYWILKRSAHLFRHWYLATGRHDLHIKCNFLLWSKYLKMNDPALNFPLPLLRCETLNCQIKTVMCKANDISSFYYWYKYVTVVEVNVIWFFHLKFPLILFIIHFIQLYQLWLSCIVLLKKNCIEMLFPWRTRVVGSICVWD
jgi:hypothetical protein